jgi:hypothetical protein
VIAWSAQSLIASLGGIGIMFAVCGRWSQKVGLAQRRNVPRHWSPKWVP